MKSKNKDQSEALFDAVLEVAAKEAVHREMQEMPSLETLNELYPTSKALDKKVYRAICKNRQGQKIKRVTRVLPRVAVVVLVFITLVTGLLISVEASRNFIRNIIIEIRESHVVFDIGQGNFMAPEGSDFVPDYLPEGFTLAHSYTVKDVMSMYVFSNEMGNEILLERIYTKSLSIGVDNEQRKFSTDILSGQEVFLFESKVAYARNKIIWEDQRGTVSISANIPMEMLRIIAEKIIQY